MKVETLSVSGMSCGHCVIALQNELEDKGITVKEISVGRAVIEYDETSITPDSVTEAVKEAGYQLTLRNDA